MEWCTQRFSNVFPPWLQPVCHIIIMRTIEGKYREIKDINSNFSFFQISLSTRSYPKLDQQYSGSLGSYSTFPLSCPSALGLPTLCSIPPTSSTSNSPTWILPPTPRGEGGHQYFSETTDRNEKGKRKIKGRIIFTYKKM